LLARIAGIGVATPKILDKTRPASHAYAGDAACTAHAVRDGRLVEVERKYLEAKAAVEKVTEEIEAEEDAAELPVEFENSRTSYREHVPFEVKARVVAGRVSPAKGL
jgi:hypothetical protein